MTKLAGGPGRGVALPLSANEASAILYLASSVGSKFHALVTPFGGRDLSSSAEFCRWSSSAVQLLELLLLPKKNTENKCGHTREINALFIYLLLFIYLFIFLCSQIIWHG